MADEETGAEPKIVSASIADPFLLLCRDDASIFVARCDESNDLEELEREDDTLLSTQWLTGCLYTDNNNVFAPPTADKRRKFGENIMMFLLSTGGALYVSFQADVYVCPFLTLIFRFTHYLISRNPSSLLKDSALCRQYCRLRMLQDGQRHERH